MRRIEKNDLFVTSHLLQIWGWLSHSHRAVPSRGTC